MNITSPERELAARHQMLGVPNDVITEMDDVITRIDDVIPRGWSHVLGRHLPFRTDVHCFLLAGTQDWLKSQKILSL